jgi:hypothetical protein
MVAMRADVKSYVPEIAKRPTTSNASPYYSAPQLVGRLFYSIRDYLKADTTANYMKLLKTIEYTRAWYGDDQARNIVREGQKRAGTILPKLADLKAKHMPPAPVAHRDFTWDISDEDRLEWFDPCHPVIQDEDGYDGFDYLAEFEIWEDQDRQALLLAPLDINYNTPLIEEGSSNRELFSLDIIGPYAAAVDVNGNLTDSGINTVTNPYITNRDFFLSRNRQPKARIIRNIEEKSPADARKELLRRHLEKPLDVFFAEYRSRAHNGERQLPFHVNELLTFGLDTMEELFKAYTLCIWHDELYQSSYAEEMKCWLQFNKEHAPQLIETMHTTVTEASQLMPLEGDDQKIARYYAA